MNRPQPCLLPFRSRCVGAGQFPKRILTVAAAAALAACGGGGGSDPVAPANQAPTVALTGPAANTSFAVGQAISITATAADSDGTVARVDFYDGTTKIGEDTTSPYQFTWASASAGTHTLSVRAIDNAGATATSGSLAVTVNTPPPANVPPTVSITSPTTGFKPNAPATFTLAATAADSDGSVSKVEFFRINPAAPVFDSTTLVGTAAALGTPPSYQLQTTQSAGTYTFVARATDNSGAQTASGSVQVIVNALPTIAITAPTAGASIAPSSAFTLRANAADADGSISKVEFFLDGSTTALGQATRVGSTTEYTLTWNTPATQGAHSFTARATDNDGATQTTASVSVNVPANVAPTITLDNPTAGTNAPTNLVLTASAADADGSVAKVEFFNGATLLGNGTFDAASSKYRLSVPIAANQATTTYTVTARVTDNLGSQTTTASKSITVSANVAPAVSITSAASFTLPAAVVLTANASDSDGIAKVEFFNGATLLGTATTAPYSFTWAAATAGSYSITARATDSVGTVTTTAVQALTVSPNPVGMWSTLSTAQKAGITQAPDKPVEDGAVDASEIMAIIGANTVRPVFNAAMAAAARALADFTATVADNQTSTGDLACPGGGTMRVTLRPGETTASAFRQYNYNNCVIDGFTFYGGAGMAPYDQLDTTVTPSVTRQVFSSIDYQQLSANTFSFTVDSLRVTGNGAPQDPGPEALPRNALAFALVTCTVNGSTKSCLTDLSVNYLWGFDQSWTGYSDNGTQPPTANYATDDRYVLSGMERSIHCPAPTTQAQCLATPPTARNIRFEAMTNNSGRAIVYGDNGYSVVTRLAPASPGVERVQVLRTITAATVPGYPIGTAPVETYQCTIAVSGDWSCTLAP